ncbi:hypothetical protein GE09DRAFT_606710 [Coniochaeta sp. 2T2.1]|nr:hypothetical protein GE09DRAFT_606710 [Coniochaeta sp. 2T2.1]
MQQGYHRPNPRFPHDGHVTTISTRLFNGSSTKRHVQVPRETRLLSNPSSQRHEGYPQTSYRFAVPWSLEPGLLDVFLTFGSRSVRCNAGEASRDPHQRHSRSRSAVNVVSRLRPALDVVSFMCFPLLSLEIRYERDTRQEPRWPSLLRSLTEATVRPPGEGP